MALMLDTFAVFAVAIYPWGFTPMALALAWARTWVDSVHSPRLSRQVLS
jgi:hypothetical protein